MTRTRNHLACVCLLVCALLFACNGPAAAQVLYGSVAGVVHDSSGSVVPAAVVTLTDQATSQSRQATANNDGTYVLADIPAGTYKLTVAAPGFRTSQTNDVVVAINSITRSDIRLQVGERADTVTVEASATPIQTDSADVHTAIT